MVISARGLDTGVARDISGVLRISRGGYHNVIEDECKARGELEGAGLEEKECLYLVGADGGVKVFERGA